ncbi:unnamed protein product [Pedinophyceae sp. YPF-701]|nr:unnamed protein product [Pedinophyceae sp. YPF-701]
MGSSDDAGSLPSDFGGSDEEIYGEFEDVEEDENGGRAGAEEDEEDSGGDDDDDAPGEDPHGPRMRRLGRDDEELLMSSVDASDAALMRLEANALLDEARVDYARTKTLQAYLRDLRDAILALPARKISAASCGVAGYVEGLRSPVPTDAKLQFAPPTSVDVIGSYLPRTAVAGADCHVDVSLELPEAVLASKDHVSHKFHAKRAVYLGGVLRGLFGGVRKGQGPAAGLAVRLSVRPPVAALPLSRLGPDRNNVRTHRAAGAGAARDANGAEGAAELLPTPVYNHALLRDALAPELLRQVHLAVKQCRGLQDCVVLLRVWGRKAGVSPRGGGGVTGFMLQMLAVHQALHGKLHSAMMPLQMMRAVLQLLADIKTMEAGLEMPRTHLQGAKASPAPLALHRAHRPCVLLDATGFVNIFAPLSRSALAHASLAAAASVRALAQPASPEEAFEAIFLETKPVVVRYDFAYAVTLPQQNDGAGGAQDVSGDLPSSAAEEARVEELLTQGLADRARAVVCLPRGLRAPEAAARGSAALSAVPSPDSAPLMVGVLADSAHLARSVDLGPSPEDAVAARAFREFWGQRAELRRFKDGRIVETAVWDTDPSERHAIPDKIVMHVLKRHIGANTEAVRTAGCLDAALTSSDDVVAASAERNAAMLDAAVDKLSKQLRALATLPLRVLSVQPLAATLRGTAPFPPAPHPFLGGPREGGGRGAPRCADPVEVLVSLEGSGKWPEDSEAYFKMRAALGIQLGSACEEAYGHPFRASEPCVDMLVDGFALRLILNTDREDIIAEKAALTGKPAAPDPALAVLRGVHGATPVARMLWLHGTVAYVSQKHPAMPAVARLAKRWAAARLLSPHVPDEVWELLACHVFCEPAASPPPATRLRGFSTLLSLLARFPFHARPLVVDPRNELGSDAYRTALAALEDRAKDPSGGGMLIAVPGDVKGDLWTGSTPSQGVVARMAALAADDLAALEAAATGDPSAPPPLRIFAPSLRDFDALLVLRKEALPHPDRALQAPAGLPSGAAAACSAVTGPGGAGTAMRGLLDGRGVLPVPPPAKRARAMLRAFPAAVVDVPGADVERLRKDVLIGFYPQRTLVGLLQHRLGHLATFGADFLGGSRVVGVSWRPEAFVPAPVDPARAHACVPLVSGGGGESRELLVVPDAAAALAEAASIGEGLIERIAVVSSGSLL